MPLGLSVQALPPCRGETVCRESKKGHARAAASWALDEASGTGAPIEFFYAYEWPAWAPAASTIPAPAVWPDGETDRATKGMLDDAITAARLSHPTVRTSVSIVNVGAALTLIDRSAEASLIVLGSQGHSAVTGLLGSVSVAVSAHAHCPVTDSSVALATWRSATTPTYVCISDSTHRYHRFDHSRSGATEPGTTSTIILSLWSSVAAHLRRRQPDELRQSRGR